MHRVIPEVHPLTKTFLTPKFHCLVTILVGKDINHIGLSGLSALWSLATLQGEQP